MSAAAADEHAVKPPTKSIAAAPRGAAAESGGIDAASATQPEALDQRAVTRHVNLGDVLQQPATTADEQQQAAARVVVVLVLLEVLGQIRDPLGQQGDLGLRRTGVGLVQTVAAQDFFFLLGSKRHESNSIFSVPRT